MNKYEAWQTSRRTAVPSTGRTCHGYPVYSRDEALRLAAELPGCRNLSHRINWLRWLPPEALVASRFDGLVYIHPDGLDPQ